MAVFPLEYVGTASQYAPLGRGLAELVTVDLARVEALDVLERVQLQALLDELELGQSGYVDPATAPRIGRILGAGRIVGGTFDVLERDRAVRLDALIAAGDGQVTPVSAPGALQAIFEVEKELVFGLLEAMDIALTPAERERIQSVPTQNLQAFLLYSRGLQASDSGDHAAAAGLFQEAAALDPGFGEAAERAEAAAGAAEVGGTPDEALSAAGLPEELVEVSVDIMGLRQQNLNAGIGAHVLPGPGARKPAQEGLGELPVPPPPGGP